MAKPDTLVLSRGGRAMYWAEQAAIIVTASLLSRSVRESPCRFPSRRFR